MMSHRPDIAPHSAGMEATFVGKRILIVEDDFCLATEMCRGLTDLGATVLGPAPTPFYAFRLLGRRGADAAVLDIRLYGTDVFEVAKELVARNIPIVFASGSVEVLPPPYCTHQLLEKPVEPNTLHNALRTLLAPRTEDGLASVAGDIGEDRLMRAVVRALRGLPT